ncbi:MAG: hypothetical protein LLG02_01200 [Pelosinus sp.]|nr:hypothetical protein [Pelosinus sp.]
MLKKNYWENEADWEWPDAEATSEESELDERKANLFTQREVGLMNSMRILWEQHVAWTRMTIISIAHCLPDLDFTVKRLLRNPKDFEVLFRHFYGDEKAREFAALLKAHLVIASELVKAAKAGDSRAAARIEADWYKNADEIAAFLSSINANWSEEELKTMLHEHLVLTKDEAVARLSGRFARDIAIYDEIEQQALDMADALTAGIVEQFPDMFVRD